MSLPKLGETFNQTIIPLTMTPRKMAVHGLAKTLCVIQADHNAYNDTEVNTMVAEAIEAGHMDAPEEEEGMNISLLGKLLLLLFYIGRM